MKIIGLIVRFLNIAGWGAAFLFFIFYYRFAFNYEIEQNYQYYLVFIFPIALINTLFLFFKTSSLQTGAKILWLIVSTLLCCFLLFSSYYSFGNECFFVLCAVFFISCGVCLSKDIRNVYVILALMFSVYGVELYLGALQWTLNRYDNSSALTITGTLENSGVYACYLIAHIPLLNFSREFLNAKVNKRYTFQASICFLFLLGTTLFLVYQTQSRTALIAFSLTFIIWLLQEYGEFVWRRVRRFSKFLLALCCLIILGGVVVSFIHLFNMKKMSAMGRLMRTEITIKHFTDQFWMGTGVGRFTWYYPQWQADYFEKTINPPQDYFLTAGESYLIFNEYLQWFKSVGVLGVIATIVLFVFFFRAKSSAYRSLFRSLKLTVIAFMACGFTSYSFHVNAFLLLIGFCVAIVFALSDYNIFPSMTRWLAKDMRECSPSYRLTLYATMSLILVFTAIKGGTVYHAARQWQNLMNGNKDKNAVLILYEKLYTDLKTDGKFLTDYGSSLLHNNVTNSLAEKVLIDAKSYFISRKTMEYLVEAYKRNGKINNAITVQEWVCCFLPNKFGPKKELLQLYRTVNDSVNTERVAQTILTMPVKVPSKEVEQIKEVAANVLRQKK